MVHLEVIDLWYGLGALVEDYLLALMTPFTGFMPYMNRASFLDFLNYKMI